MKHCCLIFIFAAFSLTGLLGQNFGTSNIGKLPVVSPPQPPNPYQYHSNQPSNPHHNPNELTEIQKRNQAIINESVTSYMNAEIRRQSTIKMLLESGFPSQSYQDPKGTTSI